MDFEHIFEEYGPEDDSDYESGYDSDLEEYRQQWDVDRVREQQQEQQRDEREQQQEQNERNAHDQNERNAHDQYTSQLETLTNEYFQGRLELQRRNIRIYSRLKQALEICSSEDMIFARDKPKGDDVNSRMTFQKEYLVAPLRRFFQFAHNWDKSVWLDEVVRSDIPCRVFFDIEVKVGEFGHIPEKDILRDHVRALGIEATESTLEAIGGAYRSVIRERFTEETCQAGIAVLLEHIKRYLKRVLPDVPDDTLDLKVLTGCRSKKFSFHVVAKSIFCDSSVITLPLLVYEIARKFSVDNTKWLFNHSSQASLATAEGRFRLKALMLFECLEVENDGTWVFKGHNDTPFDEAVYTSNHLLRAPGASKAVASDIAALAPWSPGRPCLVASRRFSDCFGGDDHGLVYWREHLIGAPVPETVATESYGIAGWKPSPSYPKPRRWYADSRVPSTSGDISHMVDRVVRGDSNVERYEEKRKTKTQRRLLTHAERANAMRNIEDFDPHEPVSPDEVFRDEDGTYKPFRLFRSGDCFHHMHNGIEERTPSARVFNGGFHCFGCARTFACVTTPAKEPLFPFEDAEIDESDDAKAFMPNIRWREKMQRKFCVVHAPMGSGKTYQLARLVNRCVRENKSVCLVAFRVMLAKQLATRLGVECYTNLTKDEIDAAPKMLVISVNSLWKVGYARDYDVVLFDEAGFTRRHFISTTCTQMLTGIYERFVHLVKAAQFVVMLQDGISLEDVKFYTEVCSLSPTDRQHVSGTSFLKPVHIHPITYTTNVWAAVHNLITAFRTAFDNEGTCVRPFMVFCNQVNFCEFLLLLLRSSNLT